MMTNHEVEPFHRSLQRVVNARTAAMQISTGKLAERLGPNYRSFMYWLEGERSFPAHLLPALCLELNDFQLMDVLERQMGRVAFRIPAVSGAGKGVHDVRVTQRLVKEVGEALESLADTLEDGIVTEAELKKTLPEIDDVIRECAHLKHWLEQHWEVDGKRKA